MARLSPSVPFGALLAFVVITVGAFIVLQIGGAGLSEAGTADETVQNESIIINYSQPTSVSTANDRYTQGYNDTVTVYNSSGTELTAGTDYDWNASAGAVTWYNTSQTTEGNTAEITYQYSQNVESVRASEPGIRTVIEAVGGPIVFIPMITFVGLLFLWAATVVWKTLFGRRRGIGGGR
jgi:hypothetical protein